MEKYESDWVFNIGLKVAVIICLATLAVGLTIGLSPTTAVFRSGSAFAVFATISWAAARVWEPALPDQPEDEISEDDEPVAEQNAETDASGAATPAAAPADTEADQTT